MTRNVVAKGKRTKLGQDSKSWGLQDFDDRNLIKLAAEIPTVKDYSTVIPAQKSARYKVVHVLFFTIPASL